MLYKTSSFFCCISYFVLNIIHAQNLLQVHGALLDHETDHGSIKLFSEICTSAVSQISLGVLL